MQERYFTVRNKAGIHCRPSGVILTAMKSATPARISSAPTASCPIRMETAIPSAIIASIG